MIDFSKLERVDGFHWAPPEHKHGHENDCLGVYRQNSTAYKVIWNQRDPKGRHGKLLWASHAILKKLSHPNILQYGNFYRDERVTYFGIRHFSPTCSHHLQALIRELRPAGILVEGPSDAESLVPWIVHPDTVPPVAILSTFVDRKNQFGLNGTLTPSDAVPVRYRGWWPLTQSSPEYQALKVGHEVGARLGFCDVPLSGTIEHTHVLPRLATRAIEVYD